MKSIISLMGICLLLSSICYGGTIEPNTPDDKYLEYGSKFHSVVRICCYDGIGMACGSAVIIDPHWVMTAAHVVEDCKSWNVTINSKKYELSKMFIHKDYNTHSFGEYDIALGYSPELLDIDHYPSLYETNDEVGKICSIAGWGLTGTFNTGVLSSDGKRRAGSNFVDRTERKVLMCSPSRRHEKITELEYLICSGDSGGGLFIDGKLAGIHSSVLGYDGKANSTYGDASCHTRVSLYIDWIKQIMETNSEKKK